MQIRQSSLTQFGDSVVRFMVEAGSHDEDMKYTLDYMHSRYNRKKVLTLISPETGGMVIFGHEAPGLPIGVSISASRIVPGDMVSWYADLPNLGMQQKQKFAQWLVNVFKSISYMDTDEQFTTKMNQLAKEAAEQGMGFAAGGTYNTFQHQLYDI